MARTKLVSIRLDVSNIAAAEELAKYMRYWTRSSVIDNILKCVFQTADRETLVNMVRYMHSSRRIQKVDFQDELKK